MFVRLFLWGSFVAVLTTEGVRKRRLPTMVTTAVADAPEELLAGPVDIAPSDLCPGGAILIATRHGKAYHNLAEDEVKAFTKNPSVMPQPAVREAFQAVADLLAAEVGFTTPEDRTAAVQTVGQTVKDLLAEDTRPAVVKRLKEELREKDAADVAREAVQKLAILPNIKFLDAELADADRTRSRAAAGHDLITSIVGKRPQIVLVSPFMRAMLTSWIMWPSEEFEDIPKIVVDQLGEKRTAFPCDTRSPNPAFLHDNQAFYRDSAKIIGSGERMDEIDRGTLQRVVQAASRAEPGMFNGAVLFRNPPGAEDMTTEDWGSVWKPNPDVALEGNDRALRKRVRNFMMYEFTPLLGLNVSANASDKVFAFVSHKGFLREMEADMLEPAEWMNISSTGKQNGLPLYDNAETRIYCFQPPGTLRFLASTIDHRP